MKISTRMIVSTTVALVIIGTSLISLAYDFMNEATDAFLKQTEKSAYEAKEKELKNEMIIFKGQFKATYERMKKDGIEDSEIKKALKKSIRDIRFLKIKVVMFLSIHMMV